MRWRRDRAEARRRQRLPGKERARSAPRIVRQCYRNLADTIVEAFWGFGASAEALKARVKFEDPELIQRAIDRRQTIVLLAAHHGNWEWLLLAAGANFPIPIDVVYQPQRLASLDEFLRDVRCRFGGKLIPRKEFVYELLSHAGEPRAYALIADQTPRKEDPKHWTRFLRQDTAFFVGAGKIAKFLESPVYFVSMRRERRGHYSCASTCSPSRPTRTRRRDDRRALRALPRARHPRQPRRLAVASEEVEIREARARRGKPYSEGVPGPRAPVARPCRG